MKTKSWWIKERDNPQLGISYTACGQLTVKEAKRMERSLYGSNTMLRFQAYKEYIETFEKLSNNPLTL